MEYLKRFRQLESEPSVIKFTTMVPSIGTFQKNLAENEDKTMTNLFNFDSRFPPFVDDGDIVEITNPRKDKVWYRFVKKPHMFSIPATPAMYGLKNRKTKKSSKKSKSSYRDYKKKYSVCKMDANTLTYVQRKKRRSI